MKRIHKQKILLAELVGIILGDGHLHKKANIITIVGSIEESHYFKLRVMKLFDELFDIKPKLKKRNDRNAYYLHLENKKVMLFLTEEVGLVRGNKINAKIPDFIKYDIKFIQAFLRGLFDTDGCIKFSKQSKDINYYPRVQLAFKKSEFANKIGEFLSVTNFNYGSWTDNRMGGLKYYQVSGNLNTKRWFDEIKPANQVHVSKYLFWKKYGYYMPKSTLNKRLKSLTLKTEDFS